MVENFPNIYGQQKRNRRTTALLILSFIVFFGFIGFGFDFFYLGVDPFGVVGESGFQFPLATICALGFGSISAIYSYQSGAIAVLKSAQAFPVPEDTPEHQMLRNVVDEMAIASGLPRPKLYIVPDADPNAFATGKGPAHSYIAVTEGLLANLNREELQGVIAHEMSHIKNYDIRLMTIVAALIGGILLLSDWMRGMMRFGGSRRVSSRRDRRASAGGPIMLILFVLWIIAVILAPIVVQLLAMAVSRKREYLADASGAELTRNPLALANALSKIESAAAPTQAIKKGSAHLCITDPMGRRLNQKEGFWAELFGTHPPISKRITLLKAMAYQYDSASAIA
ncbi:MAG: M48 family metallopeptidase [Ignavibacteriae bacterium]|nr:M48 family metallopeptidase [Ignavibacteriota bacterium]